MAPRLRAYKPRGVVTFERYQQDRRNLCTDHNAARPCAGCVYQATGQTAHVPITTPGRCWCEPAESYEDGVIKIEHRARQ